MKNKKFIYISGIFLICLLIFIPKNVWAVTDYDGNGIITQDEKQRYYKEVYGVDPYTEGWDAFNSAVDNLVEKNGTAKETNQSTSPSNESKIDSSNNNNTKNSTTNTVEKSKAADSSPKKETPPPSYTSTVTKEPTCTEEGEKTYTSDLGDSYTEVIPALGHKPGDWTTEKEPTCTEEGKKVRYCTVCGEPVETMVIDKLPHTEGDWEVVQKPTLIKTGLKVKKCTICGEVLEEEVIPANTTLLYIIIGLSCAVLIGGVIGIITYKRRH